MDIPERAPRFEPVEKLVKKISERRVVAEMTRESHMMETMVRGYQGSLVCYCWRRAILHERSEELS